MGTSPDAHRWTSSNRDIDFTGFTTPTTEATPWGESGSIVRFSLTVATTPAPPVLKRTVVDGTWTRDTHGLSFPVRTRKGRADGHANIGLCGLVQLYVNQNERSADPGFTVEGRCLIDDEARMRDLVVTTARREIDALLANLHASRDAVAILADQSA